MYSPGQKTPIPPVLKTPTPPVKTPMHPALATLIRIALGAIAVAFYSAIFGFVIILMGMSMFVNRADTAIWGGRDKDETIYRVWQNRLMWMWWDGFVAVLKYIFTGGSTDLLMNFIKSVKHPLTKVASDYWKQETRRL